MNSTTVPVVHCFALHSAAWAGPLSPLARAALPDEDAQDLADGLPFLACGEESAVHTFGSTLVHHLDPTGQATLRVIAEDELRHALWLERLRLTLPVPALVLPRNVMVRFFRRLHTRDPALHFARIAALDRAVCRLLAPLIRAQAALTTAPEIHSGLRAIARDEARHVQVARAAARTLGLDERAQAATDAVIAAQLRALLAPLAPGLQRLARRVAAP